MEETIRGLMEENRTAGMAVVLVKGGKVIYQNAFGYRDKDTREPLEIDDIFRIASISKSQPLSIPTTRSWMRCLNNVHLNSVGAMRGAHLPRFQLVFPPQNLFTI